MSSTFGRTLLAAASRARIELSSPLVDMLESYWQLLERWNAKINLTSLPLSGYPDATIERLLIEPLRARKLFPAGRVLWYDLGSGGGSPAVPLKVANPAARLVMVESRSRKAAFLREVVRTVGLSDTIVKPERFENLPATDAALVDVITVRAVRPDATLAETAARLIQPAGKLVVFGGHGAVELAGFKSAQAVELSATSAINVYVPRGTS